MVVQPSTSTSPPSVQLTDQALVAVHMADALAGGADPDDPRHVGRRPNVAHLIAGLGGEPEGIAGRFLRQTFGEMAARIALHEAIDASSLQSLATAYVALPVLDRPCWTLELLQAARRVGGEDLDFLLQGCGINLAGFSDDLGHRMPGPTEMGELLEAPETFGRLSLVDVGFSHDADLAVARTRAHGGNSHDLLVWLGADTPTREALASAPTVPVQAVIDRARLSDMAVDGHDLVTAITHLSLRAALKRP